MTTKFLSMLKRKERILFGNETSMPIPVTVRSKAWVCGNSNAGIVGSKPAGALMPVSCECCVLSGRGHCVGLITRPEESYRSWCVWVWSSGGRHCPLWVVAHEEKNETPIDKFSKSELQLKSRYLQKLSNAYWVNTVTQSTTSLHTGKICIWKAGDTALLAPDSWCWGT
jgi:hypothetical protein